MEDDPVDKYVEAYNIALCKGSEYLAPCEHMSIKAGTLTNGHTVLLLRALLAGVPCKHTSLSVDGRMSLPHIAMKDPEMARAAQEGWRWTVLHHATRTLYGKQLYELLSEMKM